MKKSYIFAVLAFVFIAVTAVADTTYVCEDVGDWDQWNVPYADQVEMVQNNIVMEIYYDDGGLSPKYEISAYEGTPNYPIGICKDKDCGTECEPEDPCPCETCSTPADATHVRNICSYLVKIY